MSKQQENFLLIWGQQILNIFFKVSFEIVSKFKTILAKSKCQEKEETNHILEENFFKKWLKRTVIENT